MSILDSVDIIRGFNLVLLKKILKHKVREKSMIIITPVYQDLSYGEILSGQPGAWLVRKKMFYMHAITNFQIRTSY